MPAEGRDLRWKGWRKGAGSREWPTAYHPGDEQQCRTSSHASAKGTARAVAVVRASTGLTTHPVDRRKGASLVPRLRETRPLVAPGKPVCEPHDSTGEPGAGNRHAGFGERGEETCLWASDCGPVRKRRMSHRALPVTRLPSTLPGFDRGFFATIAPPMAKGPRGEEHAQPTCLLV